MLIAKFSDVGQSCSLFFCFYSAHAHQLRSLPEVSVLNTYYLVNHIDIYL